MTTYIKFYHKWQDSYVVLATFEFHQYNQSENVAHYGDLTHIVSKHGKLQAITRRVRPIQLSDEDAARLMSLYNFYGVTSICDHIGTAITDLARRYTRYASVVAYQATDIYKFKCCTIYSV